MSKCLRPGKVKNRDIYGVSKRKPQPIDFGIQKKIKIRSKAPYISLPEVSNQCLHIDKHLNATIKEKKQQISTEDSLSLVSCIIQHKQLSRVVNSSSDVSIQHIYQDHWSKLRFYVQSKQDHGSALATEQPNLCFTICPLMFCLAKKKQNKLTWSRYMYKHHLLISTQLLL